MEIVGIREVRGEYQGKPYAYKEVYCVYKDSKTLGKRCEAFKVKQSRVDEAHYNLLDESCVGCLFTPVYDRFRNLVSYEMYEAE